MVFGMPHSSCSGSPSKVRAQVLGSQGFPQIAQDRLNGEMKGGSDIEPGIILPDTSFNWSKLNRPGPNSGRYGWRNIAIALIGRGCERKGPGFEQLIWGLVYRQSAKENPAADCNFKLSFQRTAAGTADCDL